jgi:hypothetical protein
VVRRGFLLRLLVTVVPLLRLLRGEEKATLVLLRLNSSLKGAVFHADRENIGLIHARDLKHGSS